MENWTEKAVSAMYVGKLEHKNNWHAIKADPRFGPWLVNFSVDDLKSKVKADEDMFAQTGLNQPNNIWQKIKADPKYGSILSKRSEDDLKNKFYADLEFFVLNLDFVDVGAVTCRRISRDEILGELNAINERLVVSREGILAEQVSRQDISAQLGTIAAMVSDLIMKVGSV